MSDRSQNKPMALKPGEKRKLSDKSACEMSSQASIDQTTASLSFFKMSILLLHKKKRKLRKKQNQMLIRHA